MKLPKTFNNLKRELFFIRRLLQEGYGPRYWWPYAKNKFFWKSLLSQVPKFDFIADPDIELHTVFQKKDIWMLIWSFRSFLIHSGLRPSLIIHDDGSLDEEAEKLLQSKFANIKVLFRDKTTKLILSMPDVPEKIKETRKHCHFFLNRPINILALSKAKKLILADTDILYFKPPTEVMDFCLGKTNSDALTGQSPDMAHANFDIMMDDAYTQKYKLKERRSECLDGGYIILNRDSINFGQMIEFLEHSKRPITHYFIEMAYFACVLAQINFEFLPLNRYHIKGPPTGESVYKHFSSPRRYEMFAYGIDMIRSALEK